MNTSVTTLKHGSTSVISAIEGIRSRTNMARSAKRILMFLRQAILVSMQIPQYNRIGMKKHPETLFSDLRYENIRKMNIERVRNQ